MIFLSLLKLKKKEGPDCPTTARDQSCHIILFWKSDKRNNKYLKLNSSSLQHVLKESGDFCFVFLGTKAFSGDFGAFFHKSPVCESHWVFFYRQVTEILPQKKKKKRCFK